MSQKFRKFITVSLHFNHNTQQIDYYTSQFDQNTSQFDDDQINIMIHHGRLVINISQQYLYCIVLYSFYLSNQNQHD